MFYITISNGLLEGDHQKKMGSSVWQFMWLIDKVTGVDPTTGVGVVLGGRPIQIKELKTTGVSEVTIQRNLAKLKENGYIDIKHAPYGLIISVNKAKKRFGQRVVKTDKARSNNFDKPGLTILTNRTDKFDKPNNTVVLHRYNTLEQAPVSEDSSKEGDREVSEANQPPLAANQPTESIKPFDLEEKLVDMEKKEGSHLDIIATFIREKPVSVDNSKQLGAVIARYGKIASRMSGAYSTSQIFEAIQRIKEDNLARGRRSQDHIDWTLETVYKYLTK